MTVCTTLRCSAIIPSSNPRLSGPWRWPTVFQADGNARTGRNFGQPELHARWTIAENFWIIGSGGIGFAVVFVRGVRSGCVAHSHFAAQARKRKDAVAYSDERLHSVLMSLEDLKLTLVECGDFETAHTLSLSILQLRMNLNRIADSDLKALCDDMIPDVEPTRPTQEPKPQPQPTQRRRRPVLLKLVK